MPATYKDNGGSVNGSNLEFTYDFPTLQTEDVRVSLNGVTQATTKYTVSLSPAKITFNNTNVDSAVQESTGAPKSGVLVRVYRKTIVGKTDGNEDPKAVFAAGSSIRAGDLNANVEQSLFGIHELQEQSVGTDGIGSGAVTTDSIADGAVNNAKIASNAEIEVSKLKDGSARELLQTDAAGTGVEWTSNVDIPGTLDVTGTSTLPSVDINGGAIDGTTIGSSSATTGKFTTVTCDQLIADNQLELATDVKWTSDVGADHYMFWDKSESRLNFKHSGSSYPGRIKFDNNTACLFGNENWPSGGGVDYYLSISYRTDGDGCYIMTSHDKKLHLSATEIEFEQDGPGDFKYAEFKSHDSSRCSFWGPKTSGGSFSSDTPVLETKYDGVAVTGNLTVSGTINGGTESGKLATIETNADVTDATNVAAAGAVMESDTTTASMNFVVDEDNMSSNSSTKLPTQQSVKKYVDDQVAGVVDSAPGALDTLNELAAALGDDANFSTTVTNSIATKLPLAGGTMTGNIVMSGSQTVDGRDLSADGTKLDAIEASATADQTAAEIRTLVGSASDSNVFTDADHTKLDGIATSANNYTHPNHSGEVTSTADGATVIADDIVDEANLKISNAGSNGQYLQKQSGNTGGLTWATVSQTDTTYTHTWQDSGDNALLRLTAGGSGSGNDDLTILAGDNITLTPSGDNLTIAASGGEITVQDEGSALSTAATTLNFVGSGVTASGTGAAKTITISGGATDFKYLELKAHNNTSGAFATGAASYELVLSGTTTAVSPTAASALLISLNGVVQKPNTGTSIGSNDGFCLDGSSIHFGGNLTAAPDFIIYLEHAGIGSPSDNAVTTAKIANDAVDGTKIADNAINSEHYTDGSIDTVHIAADQITGALIADDAVGAEHIEVLDAALQFGDSVKAQFGAGNDLEIYHDGSHSYIKDTGTGSIITASDSTIYWANEASSETILEGTANGAVKLYYDDSVKFETKSYGIQLSDYLYMDDGKEIRMGNDQDLKIYFDGTDTFFKNHSSGSTYHRARVNWQVGVNATDGGADDAIKALQNGSVELYYDHSMKLQTYAGGVYISGDLTASDGSKIALGSSADLKLHHTSNSSWIENTTGALYIRTAASNGVYILDNNNDTLLSATDDAGIVLCWDNSPKFETTSVGATVTGRLSAWYDATQVAGLYLRNSNDSGTAVQFAKNDGTIVGSISQTASATSFNTSSDYRLKENEVDISDGITRLKTLKPYKFNFKADPSKTVDGFFAHEVTPAVPEAIAGEKDGTEMQQLDQSKLVPLLTAALQEAITKIETLETKVAALEGA